MAMSAHVGSRIVKRLLIAALLLTLASFAAALQFVFNTTGGTLFVFAVLGPALVALSIVMLAAALIYEFRQRHKLFVIERFEPGQTVCRHGDAGDRAYFIRSGEVEVVRDSGGGESIIARLGKGQYFGEMALLSDEPRNATVRAVVATELAALGKSNFLMMLNALPSVQADILETVRERAMQGAKRD